MTRFGAAALAGALGCAMAACPGRKGEDLPAAGAPAWAARATVFTPTSADQAMVALGVGPRDGNGRYQATRLVRVSRADGGEAGPAVELSGHVVQLESTADGSRVFALMAVSGALHVVDVARASVRECPAPPGLRDIATVGAALFGRSRSLYRLDTCPGAEAAPLVAGEVTHLTRLDDGSVVAGLPGPWMVRLAQDLADDAADDGAAGAREPASGSRLRLGPRGCVELYPLDTQRVTRRVCPDELPLDVAWEPGGGALILTRRGILRVDWED